MGVSSVWRGVLGQSLARKDAEAHAEPEAAAGPTEPAGSFLGGGSDASEPPEALAGNVLQVPPEEGPPPLIELTEVTRSYRGRPALGPITLHLEHGTLGLIGPNGAGKSTLLRIIMGILKPTSGTVRVLGKEVGPDTRRSIGYVPERDSRFPSLTGVQAVIYAGRLVGMERAAAIARAHEVLDYVGLGEARYRAAAGYSTGMRQRLKIAQAIVHDPPVLILDEPTEGVDPTAREEIIDLLRDLARSRGTSLVVSTHVLHDMERFATHAVILNAGRVVEHGRISELRAARSRGHEVRLDGPPDSLALKLVELGVAHEWRAPMLRVMLDDSAAILRLASEAGLVVRHIAPTEMNLDEVFANALGRAAVVADETSSEASHLG